MVVNHSIRSSNQKFLRLMVGFLALFVIALAVDDKTLTHNTQTRSCRSISEIICETTAFNSFCEVLEETGLEILLGTSDDLWTVFVPTNSALEDYGIHEVLVATNGNNSNNETDYATEERLIDFILLHTMQDRLVRGTDLSQCGKTLTMKSGEDTTVVCDENGGRNVFLSGSGNTAGMLPQVVITDVVACNGLIHVINGVLQDESISEIQSGPEIEYSVEEHDHKPAEIDLKSPEEDCQTIQELVCERNDLSTMCAFLDDENILESTTTATNGLWTLFAPTDQGFDDIQDVLGAMDPNAILDILKFHTVPGEELFSDDLVCDTDLIMGNARSSRTTCSSSNIFQEGPDNVLLPLRTHPRIIEGDLTACNGVVHIVDHVLVPENEMPAMVGRTGANENEEPRKPHDETINQSLPNLGIASAGLGGGWVGRRPGRIGKPFRQVTGQVTEQRNRETTP